MKQSVYFGLAILISINALMLTFAKVTADRTCEEGEALVCYDYNEYAFHVEENASVSIEVINEDYGESLVQMFNERHPEFKGALTYVIDGEADIQYVSLTEALFKMNKWMPLMKEDIFYPMDKIAAEINDQGLEFIPMSGDGFAFITNINRLEELEINTDDLNNDYLVDALNSYSKIQGVFNEIHLDAHIMRLSLNEPYIFYPFLTAGGWRMFEDEMAYDPGFEDASFLESLKFIESLSDFHWNGVEAQTSEAYNWDYITAMEKNDFVFSIVASWMFVDALEEKIEGNWQISHFPSASDESEILSPLLSNVYGYVINNETRYPSMAHEVLRLVRGIGGMTSFFNTTDVIPLYPIERYDFLDLEDSTRLQFSKALSFGQTEPLIAFKNDPTKSAFSIYYDIDFMPIIRRLWDGEISAEEAQIEICLKSDAWLFEHESNIQYESAK